MWSAHTASSNANYVKNHNNEEDKIAQRQETVRVINKLNNWLNKHNKQLNKNLEKLPTFLKSSDIQRIQRIIKNFEIDTIVYIGTWSKEYVLGTKMTDDSLITDLLYKKLSHIDRKYLSTIRGLRNGMKYRDKVRYYDKLFQVCAKIKMKRRN